jgi:hypothetical protein
MRSTTIPATLGLALVAATVSGQGVSTVPAAAPAAQPTLVQAGLFVYPAKGQTKEQQAQDEEACVQWAQTQTGIALTTAPANTDSAAKAAQQKTAEATQGAAVAGAARGAAGGLAIGAIAGDPGEGAAIGAVAGAIGGRRAKKQAEAQAAQQGAKQAQAQNQQSVETFKKAAGACMEGRGYTVK